MRILAFNRWALQDRVTTEPLDKGYCGIALGPDSKEGLAIVEGFPLQAGRILPMRSNKYTIERIRPWDVKISVADELVHDTSLDCIDFLSVIVFEDPSEMGASVMRPNHNYFARQVVANADPDVLTLVLSAPFVGRRMASITFHSADLGATFGYLVKGVRYQYSSRAIVRYDGPTAAAQTLDQNGSYTLYIGGMDNAEEWDALEVYVFDYTGHLDIDLDPIGEIGAF